VEIERGRIEELTARESKRLDERTPGSGRMFERARGSLANGVSSGYQERKPWPIYLSHGRGAHVWDVDGNEMVDFHNGFGSMVQGHAHDAISRAVAERIGRGTGTRRSRAP
jgi:glutamate-1-semialdehyde 2,1-aminomutase